jgi:hypothetical protein
LCVRACVCVHACARVFMQACLQYTHTHSLTYSCKHACSVHILTHSHRHIHTHTHTDRRVRTRRVRNDTLPRDNVFVCACVHADARTHTHARTHLRTCMCVHAHARNLQQSCRFFHLVQRAHLQPAHQLLHNPLPLVWRRRTRRTRCIRRAQHVCGHGLGVRPAVSAGAAAAGAHTGHRALVARLRPPQALCRPGARRHHARCSQVRARAWRARMGARRSWPIAAPSSSSIPARTCLLEAREARLALRELGAQRG